MKLLLRLGFVLLAAPAAVLGNPPEIDDSYDDLTSSIAIGLPQIGIYNGLRYSGWSIATKGLGGLVPHSPENAAIAVTTFTTLTGNPGVVSTAPGTKCFDLESFYFGCTINTQQGLLSLAGSCSISVSGVRASDGQEVGAVAFNYDAQSLLSSPMLFADLSWNDDYKCLQSVTITDITPLTLVIIDDLVHTNWEEWEYGS